VPARPRDKVQETLQLIDNVEKTVNENISAFRVTQANQQSIANATWVRVIFNAEEYDLNSDMTATAFTAPVDGIYHFDGGMMYDSVEWTQGEKIYLAFRVNNTAKAQRYIEVDATNTKPFGIAFGTKLSLNVTDYVEMWVYQDSGAALTMIAQAIYNFFDGSLVRKT